jgi:phosphoribosyl 1,2-cyclic phosphodiesterase
LRVRVVSLGSGSSGNALLVQAGQTTVLVDAGFAPRILTARLRQLRLAPSALSAILLTHEHADHAAGAHALAHQCGIPLVSDPRTINEMLTVRLRPGADLSPPERLELPVGGALRLGEFEIRSFPVSHDAVAPCGYLLASAAWRVGVVTDTGLMTEPAIEALQGAHLVVIEANHDRQRLLDGPYPWHLKQRILSPTGHLSNEQTSEALVRILDDGPRWIWLAHLSRTNNTPDLARAHVREYLRARGLRHVLPRTLPRDMGPVWDSAALWGAQPAPPDVAHVAHVAHVTAPPVTPVAADVGDVDDDDEPAERMIAARVTKPPPTGL